MLDKKRKRCYYISIYLKTKNRYPFNHRTDSMVTLHLDIKLNLHTNKSVFREMTAWDGFPFKQLTYDQKAGNKIKSCLYMSNEQDQHPGTKYSLQFKAVMLRQPLLINLSTSSPCSCPKSKPPPGTQDLATTGGGEGKHNLLRMGHLELLLYFLQRALCFWTTDGISTYPQPITSS